MRWPFAVGALFFALSASGQSVRTIPGFRAEAPPKIDGNHDDPLWSAAPKAVDFVDVFSGKPAEDATEAWIAFDDEAVYVAFYAHDSKPDALIGREIRPGTDLEGEDFVVVRLDPFKTLQNDSINRFHVSCIGTQNDEIAGGRAAKREWRGDWQAAARIVEDGYTVEMRIPWSVMTCPTGTEPRDMTVNFVRLHARLKTTTIWSNTTSAARAELNGVWQGVVPGKSGQTPRVQTLAYVLAEQNEDSTKGDAGVDFRFPATSQFTLVGSLNPDFQNVEQQVETIDFSRSERFLGDARPFFAEGQALFDMTDRYAIGRLFYSRRIEDFMIGAKSYGRVGQNWNVATLLTLDEGDEINGAFNVVREFGPSQGMSVFGTLHHAEGIRNNAVGNGGWYRLGNWSASYEFIALDDDDDASQAYTYSLDYQVPKFFVTWRYSRIDEDFTPALGLIPFRDRKGYYVFTEYEDRFEGSPIASLRAELYASRFDHLDGSQFDDGFDFSVEAELRNDNGFRVTCEDREFEGERDRVAGVAYGWGVNNRFRQLIVGYSTGTRAGEDFTFIETMGSIRVLRKLDFSVTARIVDYLGTTEQYIVTVGWEFDARRAITGRIVRTGDKTNGYLAFRNSGFKGQELYLILGDPNGDEWRTRLVVKWVIPL